MCLLELALNDGTLVLLHWPERGVVLSGNRPPCGPLRYRCVGKSSERYHHKPRALKKSKKLSIMAFKTSVELATIRTAIHSQLSDETLQTV